MSDESPSFLLNKLHFPVTTLGPGNRIGIWFQGCSIQCPGCINPETWEFSPGKRIDFASLREVVQGWLSGADGLTISGGEPFDQPAALLALLHWFNESAPGRDTLVFSGYDFDRLEMEHPQVLPHIDVLISGPYLESAGHASALSGSENQEIHLLSERGKERFGAYMSEHSREKSLDVYAGETGLWFAGIPHLNDWDKLADQLAQNEITANNLHGEH